MNLLKINHQQAHLQSLKKTAEDKTESNNVSTNDNEPNEQKDSDISATKPKSRDPSAQTQSIEDTTKATPEKHQQKNKE